MSLKIIIYRSAIISLEAAIGCFVILWLLYDNLSFQAKILGSLAFAAAIFTIAILFIVYTDKKSEHLHAAGNVDPKPNTKNK